MYIASQKRKENIAEYLLYMWQIEDIIRANDLDLDRIKETVIKPSGLSGEQMKEMTDWYESLIDMMRREEVSGSGHLQMNKNIVGELADLNRRVLADARFDEYHKLFYAALPYIVELRVKAGDAKCGEIETCFNALYGVLMLRLKKTPVSEGTSLAIGHIAKFIAMLSKYFYLDEHDELFKNKPSD